MGNLVKYQDDVELDYGMVAGQAKVSSVRVYKIAFQKYVNFAGGVVAALDSVMLVKYRQHLVNNTTYSPNTVNREISSIKSIIKTFNESGVIVPLLMEHLIAMAKQNDIELSAMDARTRAMQIVEELLNVRGTKVAALLKRTKSEKLVYSKDNIKSLVDAPFAQNKNVTPTILMHRALLLTLATTGMRANEVSNLKMNQIVKVNDSYTVTNILGKTDEVGRSCKISKSAVDAINIWVSERGYESDYVFTSRKGDKRIEDNISETAIYQIVTKYAKQVGLKDFHPHSFRAYVATTLAETDVKNAQMQLGHKSAATTLNRYVVKKLQDNLVEDLV